MKYKSAKNHNKSLRSCFIS